MRRSPTIGLAVIAAALVAAGQPARASQLTELLAGNRFPLTRQLQNLDPSWRSIRIGGRPGNVTSGLLSGVAPLLGLAPNVYYTRGRMVSVQDTTYLVAYRAPLLTAGQTPADGITKSLPLELSLLDVGSIDSIQGIRSFELERELARLQQLAGRRKALKSLGQGVPQLPGPSGDSAPTDSESGSQPNGASD